MKYSNLKIVLKNIKYVSITPMPTVSSFEGKSLQTNNKNKETHVHSRIKDTLTKQFGLPTHQTEDFYRLSFSVEPW